MTEDAMGERHLLRTVGCNLIQQCLVGVMTRFSIVGKRQQM